MAGRIEARGVKTERAVRRHRKLSGLRVFIGGSSEADHWVKTVERWVSSAGATPVPWRTTGRAMGATILDAISGQDVDLALLLFHGDDTVGVRGGIVAQPRDNVLIEYGLFVGKLGRDRVAFCLSPGVKVPVDVGGLVHADLGRKNEARERIEGWLGEQHGKRRAEARRQALHLLCSPWEGTLESLPRLPRRTRLTVACNLTIAVCGGGYGGLCWYRPTDDDKRHGVDKLLGVEEGAGGYILTFQRLKHWTEDEDCGPQPHYTWRWTLRGDAARVEIVGDNGSHFRGDFYRQEGGRFDAE